MKKVSVFSLLIVLALFLGANFNRVLAGYATITFKKAVEQGWMKLYVPFGERDLTDACVIRQPTDAELSFLIEYCKANEKITGMEISSPNDCEPYIRRAMWGYLCVNQKDAASYLKLTYVPRITYTPAPTLTLTPTATPTITPTPTPTPKQEPFSLVASLNSNNLLREIIISTLISIATVIAYHFATRRWNNK